MNQDKPHGLDRAAAVRGLRKGAELLERGDVGAAVDEAIDRAHLGDAVERTLESGRDMGVVSRLAHDETPPPSEPVGTEQHPVSVSSGPIAQAMRVDPATAARDGYTCQTPWTGELADVVVICCSSEKFELQNQEFIRALGFRIPHFIQVPGGPAVLYGLAAIKGFLAKAMGLFVEKAVDLLNAKEVICIAHEECGAYRSGTVSVLGDLTRRLSRKDLRDVQLEHLRKSCRELQAQLGHGVRVLAFYASIIRSGRMLIRYEPVDFDSRVRS